MTNEACCAHCRVEYRTEDYRLTEADVARMGVRYDPDSPHVPPHAGQLATRGWWECASGCGTRFSPVRPDSPSLSETAAGAPTFNKSDCEIVHEVRRDRGGQHTGRIPSDVTVRHIPTGICVTSRDERSQWRNKQAAMRRLAEVVSRSSLSGSSPEPQGTTLEEIRAITEPLALLLAMGETVNAAELLPEIQRLNRIVARASSSPSLPEASDSVSETTAPSETRRKYMSECGWVYAQQFLADGASPIPEGMKLWRDEKVQPRDMSFGYVVEGGRQRHVQHSDWIITEIDGGQYVARDADFRAEYRLAPASASPPISSGDHPLSQETPNG